MINFDLDKIQIWLVMGTNILKRSRVGKIEANVDKFSKHIDTVSSVVSSGYYCNSRFNSLAQANFSYRPVFASTTCLPKEAKTTINKMYKVFLQKYGHLLNEQEIDNIKNVLSYMNGRDDTHELKLFKAFNTQLDNSRDESFVDVYPEFASWYKNI